MKEETFTYSCQKYWRPWLLAVIGLCACFAAHGQAFEFGMETTVGKSNARFRGELSEMVGFSELEITDAEVDSAFAFFDLDAPRWLKNLFPGLRIDVQQQLEQEMRRNVNMARFFVRYRFIGASVAVSDPRFIDRPESRKLDNQLTSIRLAVQGEAEALAEHLALIAAADAGRPRPFFDNRYDAEAYIHFKQLFLGDEPLLAFGKRKQITVDAELTGGIRLTADPSPMVNLGSVLFISERLDSLMEGGLLAPVEDITDQVAEALQGILFGKFSDPRTVPAIGWFARVAVPVNFGGGFSIVAGADLARSRHTIVKGTEPMLLSYAHLGIRWRTGFGWRDRPGSRRRK
ncbi:hypothetical protein [Phaeodactylibacter luteus]|uniref:Uncharacterized protein n=1 Tax=Phaeodactylibacter luteus TaxID=1564516 RepID=A0A5C6RZR8_9BACT|nr:hypothetical protein [Phaeodactylibacter luteus]TXB67898.1 hypothetical protein FRY97_03365 [Phaeodactylibacter luteus]